VRVKIVILTCAGQAVRGESLPVRAKVRQCGVKVRPGGVKFRRCGGEIRAVRAKIARCGVNLSRAAVRAGGAGKIFGVRGLNGRRSAFFAL
jgi:hypothetical protein